MKIKYMTILMPLTLGATVLILTACNKKEEPAMPTRGAVTNSTEATVTDVKAVGTNLTAEVQKQGGEVKAVAEGAVADANAQAQTLIDRVKGLVAEKKYPEALNAISELSKLKLSADQQSWLDEIKAQIQKAVADQTASDAKKAAGGLLGR